LSIIKADKLPQALRENGWYTSATAIHHAYHRQPPSNTHIKPPRLQTNPETISQDIENAKPPQLTTYFTSKLLRTFLWLFPLPFTPPNHITHISNLNHQQPPTNRQTLLFPLPSSYSHLTFNKKPHPTGISLLSIPYS